MRLIDKLTIVFISVLVSEIYGAPKDSKIVLNSKCDNKTITKIDRSVATIIPIVNGVRMPENEQQLRDYCSALDYNMANIVGYVRNCLGAFGPTISKLLTTPFDNEMDSICRTDQINDKAIDLMRAGECINSASFGIKQCTETLIDNLMAIQNSASDKKILTACCHAKAFEQCFMKTVSKTKNCNQRSINTIESFGYDMIGSTIRGFCGQHFEDNDKCFKLVAKTPKLNPQTYVRPKSIFLPLISLLQSYRNLKCNKNTEKRMDRLIADLIILGTDKLMPQNEIQLKEYCSKITQNMGFIYGYVDSCVSPFGQTLAKIMIFTLQKQFESVCKTGKLTYKASMILSATKCGNRIRDKLSVCMGNIIDAVVGTALAPINSRISMTCCHSYAMIRCFIDAAESTDGCTRRTIDWTENFALDSITGPVSLICGDYFGTNEKCDKLIAETPKMNPKTYSRPKSIFLPAIALLESFPDLDLD